jgi:LysR family transcriptional regulator, glycine cleavage system transcriptional activator
MIPVCSPRLLASLPERPRQPVDLLRLPLLHDAERQDWALWFQGQDVADIGHAASSGISFDDQMLLIRAAASHQGIALVTETLARPELEQGDLVRVLDVAWPQEFAYWLVCPRATAGQPKIAAFRDWLISERARPARRAARGRTP